jgi:hypothetical protein
MIIKMILSINSLNIDFTKKKIYIYDNNYEYIINILIKKYNIKNGLYIDENNNNIIESIIKLNKYEKHNESYILFKKYNIFLNKIIKDEKLNELKELIKYNYKLKFFILEDINIPLERNDILILKCDIIKDNKNILKNYGLINVNLNYYDYLIIMNGTIYYYNYLNNKKKRCLNENNDINELETNFKKVRLEIKKNNKRSFEEI